MKRIALALVLLLSVAALTMLSCLAVTSAINGQLEALEKMEPESISRQWEHCRRVLCFFIAKADLDETEALLLRFDFEIRQKNTAEAGFLAASAVTKLEEIRYSLFPHLENIF